MEMQTWCMAFNESSSKLPNSSNASGMTFDRGCVQGWKPLSSLGKVIDIHHGNKMRTNTYQQHVLVSNHQNVCETCILEFLRVLRDACYRIFFAQIQPTDTSALTKELYSLGKTCKETSKLWGFILCQISVATYMWTR